MVTSGINKMAADGEEKVEPETEPALSIHEAEATMYLKEHHISELFQNFTAALVYHRPEDPKAFIREHIKQLQEAKADKEKEPPSILDESNVLSVFRMLDVAKKGYITAAQYHAAMKNMGIHFYNRGPAGAELNKITEETFLRETKISLKAALRTFFEY